MSNKITFDFIQFCCKYANGYKISGKNKRSITLMIDDTYYSINIYNLIKNKIFLLNERIVIRDLIQRTRQEINNQEEKIGYAINFERFREEYKENNNLFVIDINDNIHDFYYKNYISNNNFTIEELALIDAIDYIRLKMEGNNIE
jgi:hypothetical protein